MNLYEAMFLIDPTFGASFETCEAEIKRLMDRAQAEILFCRKWDERRLAYRVKGRKRGIYVLVYFKAAPDKISPLHRDVQISENMLRVLVLRADGVTAEMMERAGNLRTESARFEGRDDGYDRGRPRHSEDDRDRPAPRKEAAPDAGSALVGQTAVATAEAPAAEAESARETPEAETERPEAAE